MFTDDLIKEAYMKMLYQKADKQKREIDMKAYQYEQELDKRSNQYKQKVLEDMKRQMAVIDQNTLDFKKQVREQASMHKRMIDDNVQQRQLNQTLSLEDVKYLFNILGK